MQTFGLNSTWVGFILEWTINKHFKWTILHKCQPATYLAKDAEDCRSFI